MNERSRRHDIPFHGGRGLLDRHCGRRPISAQSIDAVVAWPRISCTDLRVCTTISWRTARWTARMSDRGPTNAGDDWPGAFSEFDAQRSPNSDHYHYRLHRQWVTPAL